MKDRGALAMAVATAVGLWLYIAPGVLDYEGPQATSDRIAGALIASFSFVALWEFMRGLRHVDTVLAAWLAVSVLLFWPEIAVAVSTLLSAAVVAAVSRVHAEPERPYGGGWRAALRGDGK